MHTVTDHTPVGVLTRVPIVLDERGWCQKDFSDDNGHVCLDAAARLVITGEPDTLWDDMSQRQRDLLDKVEWLITQAIGANDPVLRRRPDWLGVPSDFGVVTNWNDEPGRTVDDVRRILAVARTLAGGAS